MGEVISKFRKTKTAFFTVIICFVFHEAMCQTLSDAAKKAGINFGTMVTKRQYKTAPPIYKQTVLNEFNMTFPENELKFNLVEPVQNKFAFGYPDSVVNWAIANGKKTRGHTLVWHSASQNPKWLTDRVWSTSPNRWTKEQLFAIMKNHIFKVVGHFKGRITEWDVVNEGIRLEDGHPNGLRKSFWQAILGDSYIDSAFVWAHQADPSAYLYFNEYGAEGNGSWDQDKSDSVYSLVKRLIARNIPIHGVGFQGHFQDYINPVSMSANIKRLGDLGLRVSFTEVDMMNTSNKPTPWKNALTACLENKNCTSFVVWGVDDLHSWMGKDCGCLVWDTLFKPKTQIYSTILNTLLGANQTIAAQRKTFAATPAFVPTPKPKVTNVSWCQNATTTALTAIGTALKWYSSLEDSIPSSAPVPSSQTAGTQYFYVTQTLDWLESEKAEVKVTINPLPTLTHNTRTDSKAWSQSNSFTACVGENVYTGPWPNVATGWSWSGPNNFSSSIRNPIMSSITSNRAGKYTATYTDPNGCKSSLDLTITVSVPSAIITSPSTSFCAGGSVVLTANAGTSYVWRNGTTAVGTTSTYNAKTAGAYTVIVTDANGCKDTSAVKTMTVNPVPTVSITSPTNNATLTTDIFPINTTVTGTNISNVSFYNGTSLFGTKTTSPYNITTPSLLNGNYTFSAIAKNTFNCSDTAKVTVKVNKIVTGTEEEIFMDNIQCFPNPFQDNLNLIANGTFDYTITDMLGNEIEKGIASGQVSVGHSLPNGLYVIKIQAQNFERSIKVNKVR